MTTFIYMDNKIAGSVNSRSLVAKVESVYCRLFYKKKNIENISIRDLILNLNKGNYSFSLIDF